MQNPGPQKFFLADYRPCDYLIHKVDLNFELDFRQTKVRARLQVKKNHQGTARPLKLDANNLTLVQVKLGQQVLGPDQYALAADSLTLYPDQENFEVEIENFFDPSHNSELEGLYQAGQVLLTQCEPHGFRRITYFIDRPDNMAIFSARLEGDKQKFPQLLCNGNVQSRGELAGGRHFVQWQDPFPKPCYLFALVAGDFHRAATTFSTSSGRQVQLEVYVDRGQEQKCQHALESLQAAMKWDQDTFGLEYDLDLYMIVATNHFNMGAMENKGLNIFNSVYVLAHPTTATDSDYQAIESVIGHEYFHNWSGNRVTCRDWFQLTLKEGLTVFRDQEFSADLHDRSVQRIRDVARLRETQFPEDAGPNAHPIRPDHYIEINNFYTPTVYEKGAEIIRMQQTLVGPDKFKQGLALYFKRHDGQAVTCEDFQAAMEDASNISLADFSHWYSNAGTPLVQVENLGAKSGTFQWRFKQSNPRFPQSPSFVIPLSLAWFDQAGQLRGERMLELKERQQDFQIPWEAGPAPVLSVNRGFSAPVQIQSTISDQDLKILAMYEPDGLARYEACFCLMEKELQLRISGGTSGSSLQNLLQVFEHFLQSTERPALLATLVGLPSTGHLMQKQQPLRPEQTLQARLGLARDLGQHGLQQWQQVYQQLHRQEKGQLTPEARARRSWKNQALKFLIATGEEDFQKLALEQLKSAATMTDAEAALRLLCGHPGNWRQQALNYWEQKWQHEPLVMYKWLSAQSCSEGPDTLERVDQLRASKHYDRKIPNSVYALMRGLAQNSGMAYHPSGLGHQLLSDEMIVLDKINPQVAARLSSGFNLLHKMNPLQRPLAEAAIKQVIGRPGVSPNLLERLNNILNLGG